MRIPIACVVWLAWTAACFGTPVPTYGTYFGSGVPVAVCVDQSGNVIVAGSTSSQTLPGTENAFQPTKATGFPSNTDAFIAKFDPTGQFLLWASFLGGDGNDIPTAVAADTSGNIYVTGTTTSSTFPVTSSAFMPNGSTGFAAKVSADGRTLMYSTYLPGAGNALVINGSGEAYIGGVFSLNAVTPGALGYPAEVDQGTGGISLLCLNANGTGLVFDAYLGGGGFNGSVTTSVALDAQSNIYIAGFTAQSDIPTTSNALQLQYSNPDTGIPCCSNGFIVEVNPTGSQLLYGTYLGPKYYGTAITSLVVAQDGVLYLSGSTNTTMQATPGAYLTTPSASFSGFIAKLTLGHVTLDAFTYVPCATSAPEEVSVPQIRVSLNVGNEPEVVYASFVGSQGALSVAELNIATLSLVSSFTSSAGGFSPLASALAAPHSLWVVGAFGCCSLGSLISSNAFQSEPNGTSENGVIVKMTDVSPTISFVASSATGTSPMAAGELISIYGTQLGPTVGSTAQIGPDGKVTTANSNTQVLFDGVAAPLLYVGANQVNTVIPCAVSGHSSTQMVVQYMGAQSAPITIALSAAAPGIFTDDGSGRGQGAILNQDYSLNSSRNPAVRGSYVTFYATGVGPTFPCIDGQIYQSNFPMLTLPVLVGVGNSGVQVTYAGQAPDLISGVAQFNIVIPNDAPTGAVPLTLVVDGIFSPSGVTISVK